MSGIIRTHQSGEYDMWIPPSPRLPSADDYKRFKESRLRYQVKVPVQCVGCLHPSHHWDLADIRVGIKVQRIATLRIEVREGRLPLHIMHWAVAKMTFKARGCAECQHAMIKAASRVEEYFVPTDASGIKGTWVHADHNSKRMAAFIDLTDEVPRHQHRQQES